MPDIKSLTAAELLRLYRKRELSPVEVTRDQLDRIEKFEPAHQRLHHRRPRRRAESREGLRGALAQGRADRPRRRPRRDREGQCLAEGISVPPRVAHQRPDTPMKEDAPAVARLREAAPSFSARPRCPSSAGSAPATRRSPASRAIRGSSTARPAARPAARRRGAAQSRPPAHRHRRRGLDPHPGGLHRRVRHQAELRPRAGLSGLAVQHPGACRAADAHASRTPR